MRTSVRSSKGPGPLRPGPLEMHPGQYIHSCGAVCGSVVHLSTRLSGFSSQPPSLESGPSPLWPDAKQGRGVVNGSHQQGHVTWHLFQSLSLYN